MPTLNHLKTDVLIIGASASGLMCAIEAGKRGRKVIVIDHANKAGKKILMSGGGRCNFTNMDLSADNYISHNPHFCKSALSRYTQWDFLALINEYNISYHERDHGQLFCDDSAKDILDMLLAECRKASVDVRLNCSIQSVQKHEQNFHCETSLGSIEAEVLVVASGGLSIPKMCASPLGYQLAEQFGHHIWPTYPGLVPFTLQPEDKEKFSILSGIAIDCIASNQRAQFRENLLFTHRGLSGPAMLQLSSYWKPGESIRINVLPGINAEDLLLDKQRQQPRTHLKNILSEHLPKRLLPTLVAQNILEKPLQEISRKQLATIAEDLHHWRIKPNATEGYRTAEVTLGGVDCDELSSKTLESKKVDGLYFIGEVVDVTGWLGGYNFQWAWASGWCAGQVV